MQIDLRTVTIKPLRNTFTHIARRFGGDKPASRYQEATFDVQAEVNFHYRPLWAPEYEIYDKRRTAIVMKDWYALVDPRQFYYGSYTLARARMQEAMEADFTLVEERGLALSMPAQVRDLALSIYLPLRHAEWGANMNNDAICAYGYGTAVTAPCLFHAMDHLGMAQYITRIGLLLDDAMALDKAKTDWLQSASWQGLRKYVEDSFVMADWFELYVTQNFVLDGLLYPLAYGEIDGKLAGLGAGAVLTMLTRFQADWYAETSRWVDAVIKRAAAESAENKKLITDWCGARLPEAVAALTPLAHTAFGADAAAVMDDLVDQFRARAAKLGLSLQR